MKTTSVLSSLLFGSIAAAAPFDKRALVYKTEVVTETVVVYTTVWDTPAVPSATTTPAGYFYEQPKSSSQAPVVATSAAAPAVPETKPSSTYVAPPAVEPTPTPSPAPAPVVEQPKSVEQPATSAAYVAPAPVVSSAAPAPAQTTQASSGSGSTGATYSNVDITIYDNNGGYGACGTVLHDTDMIVALAKSAWGASTYDTMTGEATNPWCGQKIKIDYNGNSVEATVMDMCPGCADHDIDLSLAAWKKLTGLDEKTRLKASWSKIG